MPDPSMIPNPIKADETVLRQHVAKLFEKAERILDTVGISEDFKAKTREELGEIINAEILLRMDTYFSEAERKEFSAVFKRMSEDRKDGAESLASLLNAKFSTEDKIRIIAEVTENVLKEFTEKMPV